MSRIGEVHNWIRIGNSQQVPERMTNWTTRIYFLWAQVFPSLTKKWNQRKPPNCACVCAVSENRIEYREGNCSETALMYFSTLVLVPLFIISLRGSDKTIIIFRAVAICIVGIENATVFRLPHSLSHTHTDIHVLQAKIKRKRFDVSQTDFERQTPWMMTDFVHQLLTPALVPFPFFASLQLVCHYSWIVKRR